MPTLKQGDLIKSLTGHTRKIIEVYGIILFVSHTSNHESYEFIATEDLLKRHGYTWDTPAWEPTEGMNYFFINENGSVYGSVWTDDMNDRARRDFLGIHETKELCRAASLEIRRKLGK